MTRSHGRHHAVGLPWHFTNTVQEFSAARVLLRAGTDDMGLVSGSVKGECFLPDSPVKWHGE
jgi:hypothetical protein